MYKWILVDRTEKGKVSGTAMKRFVKALEEAGITFEKRTTWSGTLPERIFIAAKNTDALAGNLLYNKLTAPESIQLASNGAARVISGSDERGLAYALIEMAERIEIYGERALDELENLNQSPYTAVRGTGRNCLQVRHYLPNTITTSLSNMLELLIRVPNPPTQGSSIL